MGSERPTPERLAELRDDASSVGIWDYGAGEMRDAVRGLLAEVDALTAEREEARDWARRLTASERVLTCAFCGEAYPPGTPETNHERLTAHVFVCAKHPIRAFIVEAVKRTCGPADVPSTDAERALLSLDAAIEDLDLSAQGRLMPLQEAVWQALGDEVGPLHQLVKAAGACICPAERPEGL